MSPSAQDILDAYATHGSKRATAKALGVPIPTLRRWLKDIAREGKPRVRAVLHKTPFNPAEAADYDANSIQSANGERPDAQRPRCVVFLPDMHVPYDDARAVDIAINHAHRRHSPTDLILGGDFADLFEMSRFASTPRMHPDEEVAAVVRRLEDMRAAFPTCQRKFLMGNHERRVVRYIQNEAPKLARILGATIPALFQLERLGFTFHDNRETWESRGEFLKIGKLIYCHGDELPGASGKYAPLRVAERHRQNIIYGHLHNQDASPPLRDLAGHVIKCWQVGCLHTRTPHYMPGASHSLGFAVVEYDADGSGHFTVYNYLIDDQYKVRM